jgi:hypothetical protein
MGIVSLRRATGAVRDAGDAGALPPASYSCKAVGE